MSAPPPSKRSRFDRDDDDDDDSVFGEAKGSHVDSSIDILAAFKPDLDAAVRTHAALWRRLRTAKAAADKLQTIVNTGAVPKSLQLSLNLQLPEAAFTEDFQARHKTILATASQQLTTLVLESRRLHVNLLQKEVVGCKQAFKTAVQHRLEATKDILIDNGGTPDHAATHLDPFLATIMHDYTNRVNASLISMSLTAARQAEVAKKRAAKRQAAAQAATVAEASPLIAEQIRHTVADQLSKALASKTRSKNVKSGRRSQARHSSRRRVPRPRRRPSVTMSTRPSRGQRSSRSRHRAPTPNHHHSHHRPRSAPPPQRGQSSGSSTAPTPRTDSRRPPRRPPRRTRGDRSTNWRQ